MKSFIAGFVALAGSAVVTSAAGVYVGHVTLTDSYGTTPGGEFRAERGSDWTTPNPSRTGTAFQTGTSGNGIWETFCLEKNESITLGTSYKAYVNTETQASASAYAGGAHGGFNDALDARTAYLYTRFITQSLVTSYSYTNATQRASDANALQTAIWFIEGEDSTALTGKALQFYNEAQTAFSNGTFTTIGNVRVLNLTTDAGVNAQDQLIMSPSFVVIPLPSGAAMAGVGLLAVGARRRRVK